MLNGVSGPRGDSPWALHQRADRIADRVRDLVMDDGWFGRDRNANLQEIRAIIADLSPAESRAVFRELGPIGWPPWLATSITAAGAPSAAPA